MPPKAFIYRFKVMVLFVQGTGGVDAQQADQRHRKGKKEKRLRDLDPIDPAQNGKPGKEKRARRDHPKPGFVGNIKKTRGVDAQKIRQILGRLPTFAPRATDHVKRHAKHPMAGRGPHDSKRDPEPEVGKRPHVDQFENG